MDVIRLGYPGAALHEASAAAVARVLEAHELEVEYLPAAPDADAVEEGIDLFACAWLPHTNAALLACGRMRPLGVLYRPAMLWSVVGGDAGSIADLAARPRLERRILAPPGPLARAAMRVMRAYRLDEAGYVVETVPEREALAWAQDAATGRVVPMCRPHALLHAAALRPLEDPLAALGPEQQASLLVRTDVQAALDPDLIDELEALTLGNRVVSAMAHAMRIEAMSAEQAADAWQRGKLTPRG